MGNFAVFLNVTVSLRIYLRLTRTFSGELSHYGMAVIKNERAATVEQDHLNRLVIMSTECDIFTKLDFSEASVPCEHKPNKGAILRR